MPPAFILNWKLQQWLVTKLHNLGSTTILYLCIVQLHLVPMFCSVFYTIPSFYPLCRREVSCSESPRSFTGGIWWLMWAVVCGKARVASVAEQGEHKPGKPGKPGKPWIFNLLHLRPKLLSLNQCHMVLAKYPVCEHGAYLCGLFYNT